MAGTLARSDSPLEERTSNGRDEGPVNDTHGQGSQILLSPDLFRPTEPVFAPPPLNPSPLRDLCALLCKNPSLRALVKAESGKHRGRIRVNDKADMRKLVAISGVLLLGIFSLLADEPNLKVEGAWMRAVPPSVSDTAVYFTITNLGKEKIALKGATTPIADSVEPMITTKSGEGANQRLGMEAVDSLEVPPGGKLVLEPGGNHLMVMGLKKHPTEGEKVNITIKLEPGNREIRLEIPVSRKPTS
jgi:periplasmic copper chaperone A